MSLTTGRGPLSRRPLGRFSAPLPTGVSYVEPLGRRVRAVRDGHTLVDTERVLLVHRPGEAPAYLFPAADAGDLGGDEEPGSGGYVRIAWDAVDQWWEEEQQVHSHPRNPYHRIDIIATRRRLRVEVAGEVIVDTTETTGLWETSLDARLYVERRHVRRGALEVSPTTTYCPYKGTASYWTAVVGGRYVADVAWSYEDPLSEAASIRGMLAFDPARASVFQEVPPTS